MNKPKQLKSWDRRPYPAHGEKDKDKLYVAVGRALSAWERYEAALAFMFAHFVGPHAVILPAQRAYAAIRTFEARSEMIKAASTAYFLTRTNCKAKDDLQKVLKARLAESRQFSQRRNDIAHGVVDRFDEPGESYALFPPYGTLSGRDAYGKAEYCYTAAELEHFITAFDELREPAIRLAADIQIFETACLNGLIAK